MVRERTGEQLDAWLAKVAASHLEAFDAFVTGVYKLESSENKSYKKGEM
jgi:hypothetical protein